MHQMKSIVRAIGTVIVLATASFAQADYNTPQSEGTGEIYALDFANRKMIVGGSQYTVSQTAEVEIGGSYGAFTMLQKGMKIEFTYLHYKDGTMVIQTINQVNEIVEF